MAIVTDGQLRKVVTDLSPTFDTSEVRTLAGTLRTEYLASSGLNAAKLSLIELYIAAHLAVLADQHGGMKRQSQGEASETYREIHPRNTGLNATNFGQTAIMFDTSGTLAQLAATKAKAELRIV